MERNHSKHCNHQHIRTWVPIFAPAYLQTWRTLYLYPGNREGHLGVQSCQQLPGALKCDQLMWRIPISQGQSMVPWTVRPNYWPNYCLGPKIEM